MFVGGERTKNDDTSPQLYIVLTSATIYAGVSSFLVTATVAIALYRLAHKDESDCNEGRDFQGIMETGFQMSQPSSENVSFKVKKSILAYSLTVH